MSRRLELTPLAAAAQTASLLAIAAGVFGILISDISRHRVEAASAEAWHIQSGGNSR